MHADSVQRNCVGNTFIEMKYLEYPGLLKEAGLSWVRDQAGRMSAALAYYAIFSIAPLLVILISMIALVYGQDAAEGEVAKKMADLVGETAAQSIQSAVATTADQRAGGIWATVVGFGILIFGATRVVGELKNSLNSVWGVAPKPGIAIQNFLRDRLLSVSLILCIGFLLLLSIVVSAAISGATNLLGDAMPTHPFVWQFLDLLISVFVISCLFAMIFKVLPDVVLRWRDVVIGAVTTALLFTLGKVALGWYLGSAGVASVFGAAGSLVVVLLWFYYATGILFFGMEVVKAQVRRMGGTSALPCAIPLEELPKPFEGSPVLRGEEPMDQDADDDPAENIEKK